MKKVFTILAAVLITACVFAQSPEKMSYQAVIRNTSDALVANTQIGIHISILQGSASGTAVYVETQTPTTNDNGLVSIEIGAGTVESGDFSTIDWVNGPYFIKTETDPTGGTNYSITGNNQLLSVPYALHAKTSESALNNAQLTNSDTQVYNGNAITSWSELDLSSFIGTAKALVFLKVINNDATNNTRFLFREKGDNSTYQLANDPGTNFTSINAGCSSQIMVRTSDEGIIEWISNNSFSCTIELISFIK